jgi:hypothetical protein
MPDEYEFFQGAVLRQLIVSSETSQSFRPFVREGRIAAFVLNGLVGLYIKHSSKRMSPWRFSFTIEQAADLLDLEVKFPDSFMVFVCETDGVVAIPFAELHEIVDFQQTDNAWVSVSRPPRSQYSLAGNKAERERKVSRGIGVIVDTTKNRLREKYAVKR